MALNSYKGIKIDAANGIVHEVTITGLSDLQKHVGGYIAIAVQWDPSGDVLFVDDEGLLKSPERGFVIDGGHQPFAGNGILVGKEVYDEEGECIDHADPALTVENVRDMVRFGRLGALR